jgi:signal transduction histidine kinase
VGCARGLPSAVAIRFFSLATWAWLASGAALVLVAWTAVLAVMSRDVSGALVFGALGYALVGSLILARRPGQRMGPLLCAIALAAAFSDFVFVYSRYTLVYSPGSLPFGTAFLWINTWSFAPAVCLTAFVLPLVFPDGRLLSRRWRPVLWAALLIVPLTAVGRAFIPETMGSSLNYLPNPYAIPSAEPVFGIMMLVAVGSGLVVLAAVSASVVLRWRRSGQVVRLQLKWFLATIPILVAGIVANDFFPDPVTIALGIAGGLLPVAIGVAVLRYRLYEIDVILSRAVLYAVLSGVVAVVYLAVVAIAGGMFGVGRSLGVQVLATVIAALALWPLRGRVQRGVQRLFFGDRDAPYAAMARLGHQVEEAAGAESVLGSVAKTVADSLRLPYAAVELRQGNSWVPAAAWGLKPAVVKAFPLVSQRETVGRLLVGQRSPGEQLGAEDERLLEDLARQVGPTAHAVALRGALEASLAKRVAAREEERRRLRRDLHDELGPTLAGLTLGLDTARSLANGKGNPEALQQLLSRLKTETQQAVTDVRRIVYGLRPPALDELGLAGSLREEIARLRREAPAVAITLHCQGDELAGLPAAVEVAAYRIVTEALTNVVRHSHACSCEVRINLDQGLAIDVCDDGIGFPEGWRAGVGITAMRERAAELGGDLGIQPREPHGTSIAARLPAGRPG